MPELNSNIDPFECYVRNEFLYNLERGHGEFTKAVAFAISSIQGRALGFHVMLNNGAVIWRLPIHALAQHQKAEPQALDVLQLWDCFSYHPAVETFGWMAEMPCQVKLKDGLHRGHYMFTVDWSNSVYSESAGDIGHKCAHVIALENGNYAAQPNNRILWASPAFVGEPYAARPDYLTNTHEWKVENASSWTTTDGMFYEVKDEAQGEKAQEVANPPHYCGAYNAEGGIRCRLCIARGDGSIPLESFMANCYEGVYAHCQGNPANPRTNR